MTEGFYFPALEEMYLSALVVCPGPIGNRGFCVDGFNCFNPLDNYGGIYSEVTDASSLEGDLEVNFLTSASATAQKFSISSGRH